MWPTCSWFYRIVPCIKKYQIRLNYIHKITVNLKLHKGCIGNCRCTLSYVRQFQSTYSYHLCLRSVLILSPNLSLRILCWMFRMGSWYTRTWVKQSVSLEWWLCTLHFANSTSASACVRIPHHTTPAKPQRNTNTHRTRAIQPMK